VHFVGVIIVWLSTCTERQQLKLFTLVYALICVLAVLLLVCNDTVEHMAWLCSETWCRFRYLVEWSRISELGYRLGSVYRTNESWAFRPNLPLPPIYITVFIYLYLVTPISKLTGPLVFSEVFRGFIHCILTMKFKAVQRLLASIERFCFLELVNILKFLMILSYTLCYPMVWFLINCLSNERHIWTL
jgi:hypothetical protein